MPLDDSRTDEQLVEAYYSGNKDALETLLNRYTTLILTWLAVISFFNQDEPYLDDIRQKALETIFNELGHRKFGSLVEDSFRKWAHKIAYFACMNADKKRRAENPLTSEVFANEETNLADLMLIQTTPRTSDYEEVEEQLNNALPKLSTSEQKLMTLVGQKVPYKKIRKLREFKKYSLDYLKLKIHNIRKRMREK